MARPTTRNGRCFNQRTRDRLKVSRIIDRLQAYVLGEKDPATKRRVIMKPGQIQAARILLAKSLPDLRAVTLEGAVSVNPFEHLSDGELHAVIAEMQAELDQPPS